VPVAVHRNLRSDEYFANDEMWMLVNRK
jgi:hypothetical protein